MTARVLVIDDKAANVKLLEAKLSAEYFDVKTATNGPAGLAMVQANECDIVLLDVMMPHMDGLEVCRRIKGDPLWAHIPVVMVTALDQPADRVAGLDAGADDFLTKPIDEVALIARVRSLIRLKNVRDELRARALRSKDMGMGDPLAIAAAESGLNGQVLVIEDRPSVSQRMFKSLSAFHMVEVESAAENAVFRAAEHSYDLAIISLNLAEYDGLRICAQLRSLERTRDMSVLMVAETGDKARKRLFDSSRRPQRALSSGSHASSQSALCGELAQFGSAVDGARPHRSLDGPAQPPLSRCECGHPRQGCRAKIAPALADRDGRRPLQDDQRHLRP
jgi:two-component system, cell cycle response regulator